MKLKLSDIVVLSFIGSLMAVSDSAMDFLPNVHLIGVFTVATTAVYRKYALLSVYIYVFLQGAIGGFSLWWIPYLYIWSILWLFVMIIPKKLPEKAKNVLYVICCALHGFLFGILYAPAQALIFGLDFKGTIVWIIAGLYFDAIHGVSNLILGSFLIYPIIKILKNAKKYSH